MRNFAGKNAPFEELVDFQPKQRYAFQRLLDPDVKYLLYGGAAGGGKSYFLRWAAIGLIQYYKAMFKQDNVRVGLFCEDYPSLQDRQLSKIRFEFPRWLGSMNEQRHEFQLRRKWGGGVVAFRNLDDPTKYLSAEFAAVLIDELTRDTRDIFDFLTGMRMRWIGIPQTKFVAATNPGGIGHAWVKKLWIDKDFSGEQPELYPEMFDYVKALYSDNRFLDPSYEQQLKSLPENLRRAYMSGDWDVFAGQMFSEFRRDVHVVEPFEIPPNWTRVVGIDYGYTNPFSAVWMAIDDGGDNDVYVYRNLNMTGLNATEQATKILLAQTTEKIDKWYADPSMFAKNQTVAYQQSFINTSIADIYRTVGIQLTPALNDRIQRVNILHEMLNWNQYRKPRIKIFEGCSSLIRTLPSLVRDENKVEDVDTDGDDHDYDALTYALLTHFGKAKFDAVIKKDDREVFEGYDKYKRPKDKRIWWR